MPSTKRRASTKVLLTILAELQDTTVQLSQFFADLSSGYGSAYRRGGHGYVQELKRLRRHSAAEAAFRNLRRARYITARRVGKRFAVALTPKGQAALFVERLRQLTLKYDQAKYTVVVFDVPETEERARRQLRWLLRQGGFRKLQQSVWWGPVEAYQLVAAFVRQVGLGDWVNLFQASRFFRLPR